MTSNSLLRHVSQKVHEIEPDAEIILFGSRVRGHAHPESDWDFLILVDRDLDDNLKQDIRHRLYEIEWSTGEVISSIIQTRKYWNSPRSKSTPFYQNVVKEGIKV